jgi:hypothetical protein
MLSTTGMAPRGLTADRSWPCAPDGKNILYASGPDGITIEARITAWLAPELAQEARGAVGWRGHYAARSYTRRAGCPIASGSIPQRAAPNDLTVWSAIDTSTLLHATATYRTEHPCARTAVIAPARERRRARASGCPSLGRRPRSRTRSGLTGHYRKRGRESRGGSRAGIRRHR